MHLTIQYFKLQALSEKSITDVLPGCSNGHSTNTRDAELPHANQSLQSSASNGFNQPSIPSCSYTPALTPESKPQGCVYIINRMIVIYIEIHFTSI